MQDYALTLSDKQTISGSAVASENYINEDVAFNTGAPFIAETFLHSDFSASADFKVTIQASATSSFSTVEVLGEKTVAKAKAVAGTSIQIPLSFNKKKENKYIRAYYTGTMTGSVSTVIQPRVQTN